jgi:preprotein translocase subunit YajC
MDMVLPLGMMFLVFYFLIIRPNQKKLKLKENFLTNLGKGQSVITNGGVLGRVVGLTDAYVTLEVSDNCKIKVLKSHINGSSSDVDKEQNGKKGKE